MAEQRGGASKLEHRVSDALTVDEGLYVFDPAALGPHCGSVKLVLYSDKEPGKGETRVVDPAVVRQISEDFDKRVHAGSTPLAL